MMITVSGRYTDIEFRGSTTLERPALTTDDDARVEGVRQVVEMIGSRDVILDPSLMDSDKAYNYALDGIEYVAIRRSSGRIDFYEVPDRR